MRQMTWVAGLILSCALYVGDAKAEGLVATADEAVARLLDSEVVAESETLRITEFAERATLGIKRWRFTFISAETLIAVKIDQHGETEVLGQFKSSSIYDPVFYAPLSAPRDLPDLEPLISKAREMLTMELGDSVVEPGHILLYKICLPANRDATPKYANGCKRSPNLLEVKIYMKVTPPKGEWLVKQVLFAGDEPAQISDGPRGFFE